MLPTDEPTEKPKGKSKKKTAKKVGPPVLYKKINWKGVREVFKCVKCAHCEDIEDEIKLHALTHFPKKEREKQLDLMTR